MLCQVPVIIDQWYKEEMHHSVNDTWSSDKLKF